MLVFYVADRTDVFQNGTKRYNESILLYICLFTLICAVCTGYKLPPINKVRCGIIDIATVPVEMEQVHCISWLNRAQTLEWKGWMQVVFLLYHYFGAIKLYKVVRILVAAYVWLTGYGNFYYYYSTQNFSINRFATMQFRLNFLAFCVCGIMNNEYMLYYICMLHTCFTVMIYASLFLYFKASSTFHSIDSIDENRKIVVYFISMTVLSLGLFPSNITVFETIWYPLKDITSLHSTIPSQNTTSSPQLYWHYRARMDYLVFIPGMICAYMHLSFSSNWGNNQMNKGWFGEFTANKYIHLITLLLASYGYYCQIYQLPTATYQRLHPYTSFIPIGIYALIRNMHPLLRVYSLKLFEWIGEITLETYISQFHIWLNTPGINANPRRLLLVLPQKYQLANLVLTTCCYVFISKRISTLTHALKQHYVRPHDSTTDIAKTTVIVALGYNIIYTWCYLIC